MANNKETRLSFRVEFSIKCPSCDKPVPLDGPLEIVHCESCGSDIPFTLDYWVETLKEARDKMFSVKIGQGTSSMIFGTFAANLSLARFNPYCDQCKNDFKPTWMDSIGGEYKCESCGILYPIASPPRWLQKRIPQITYLINALFEIKPGDDQQSISPEVLSCPSCSAALNVDGSTRFVNCNYCNSQVYLSDALWRKFHKVKQKRRWFVVCK